MDQNSNFNRKVIQGDFPIKYGTKTLKHPWSISFKKTLGHFEITFLKYNEKSIFLLFQILIKALQKKIKNSNYIALY